MVKQTNILSEVCSQIGSEFAKEHLERAKSERFLILLLLITLSKSEKQQTKHHKEAMIIKLFSLIKNLMNYSQIGDDRVIAMTMLY